MAKADSGLNFLLARQSGPTGDADCGPLCVVSGDEAFLKREVLLALRGALVGEGDADLAWSVFVGREADWRDVRDALTAVSLFGGGARAALVEDADTFVTAHRQQLEAFVEKPPAGATLVLDVKSWNGSTRLAKAAASAGGLAIKCQAPDRGAELAAYKRQTKQWLVARARHPHGAKLEPAAAETLLELLPLSLGVLDQEVAKLALLAVTEKPSVAGAENRQAATAGVIDAPLVQQHVGGWRTRKTWDMIDAMADGDAAGALGQLDRLLLAGEQPIGLLAQVGSTLRRFSAAACLVAQAEAAGRRGSLRQAIEQAGVIKFKLGDAERQLKQIGRGRAACIDRWLLEADLAMKGHNSTPARARIELERLIARLSKAADPRRAATRPATR
ncbi:MAG: DNA polymerase III subunit delta [Planctomycetota bacterium]